MIQKGTNQECVSPQEAPAVITATSTSDTRSLINNDESNAALACSKNSNMSMSEKKKQV